MLRSLVFSTPRLLSRSKISHNYRASSSDMGSENLLSQSNKSVNLRLSNVSIYTAEVLEIEADDPKLHVLFVPGNPDGLHQTGITEYRSSYSTGVTIYTVGHSIGAYVALEMLKRSSEKVIYYIGLYPFLALIRPSVTQSIIGKVAASNIASTALSYIIASLGILPSKALRFLVSNSLGRSWSATAVEAACTHLSQLTKTPDWAFMRENQSKIAFLFGVDDHWGPQELYEEALSFSSLTWCSQISKQVPDVPLAIERHGHTHNFSCSEAGSAWVASHVAGLIKNKIPSPSNCQFDVRGKPKVIIT
ncbi:alpha/beta-Hydrolases superfamily protein [Citrus sinensis]|nr:alpha/beta-Hydrolases superfamily protein [Citrus sinensis]